MVDKLGRARGEGQRWQVFGKEKSEPSAGNGGGELGNAGLRGGREEECIVARIGGDGRVGAWE